jgi:hypothetical protein
MPVDGAMPTVARKNLAPDRFAFWTPPPGATVATGADAQPVPLPEIPLPIWRASLPAIGAPDDHAIGQGVYDYLRQFPDCAGGDRYAALLRDAYPHFLADLAAHAVMLDAKQVEPSYVLRKLTCLKILALLEPCNPALLWQLARGFFDLALEFTELARCRDHLRDSMRFGQNLLVLDGDDPQALSLLAEIDLLLGDLPAACGKWRLLLRQVTDPGTRERITQRLAAADTDEPPASALIEELETVAEAMRLHVEGDDGAAATLLDRIAEQGRLPELLPSADFFHLLGLCRAGTGDSPGAAMAYQQALDIEPDHAAARAAMSAL